MAFFKFRARGPQGNEGRNAAAAAPAESVEAMRRRARHRLLGAAVLVLLGVVGFPLLFDTQPRPMSVDIPIEIPDRNKVKPLALPADARADTPRRHRQGRSSRAPPLRRRHDHRGRRTAARSRRASWPPPHARPPKPSRTEARTQAGRPRPRPSRSRSPKPEAKAEAKAEPKPEAKPEPKPAAPKPSPPSAERQRARARALLEGKPRPPRPSQPPPPTKTAASSCRSALSPMPTRPAKCARSSRRPASRPTRTSPKTDRRRAHACARRPLRHARRGRQGCGQGQGPVFVGGRPQLVASADRRGPAGLGRCRAAVGVDAAGGWCAAWCSR